MVTDFRPIGGPVETEYDRSCWSWRGYVHTSDDDLDRLARHVLEHATTERFDLRRIVRVYAAPPSRRRWFR